MLDDLPYPKLRPEDEALIVDTAAARLTDHLVESVVVALRESAHVTLTPRGHHLDLSLTADGQHWLRNAVEPLIRGQLYDHRASAALAEQRERLALRQPL